MAHTLRMIVISYILIEGEELRILHSVSNDSSDSYMYREII